MSPGTTSSAQLKPNLAAGSPVHLLTNLRSPEPLGGRNFHQPAMSAPDRRQAGPRNRSEPTGETHPAVLDAAVGVAPS